MHFFKMSQNICEEISNCSAEGNIFCEAPAVTKNEHPVKNPEAFFFPLIFNFYSNHAYITHVFFPLNVPLTFDEGIRLSIIELSLQRWQDLSGNLQVKSGR